MSALSRKSVSRLAANVEKWETGQAQRIHPDKFLRVARLYNAVISAVIPETSEWTLADDGYRTVLATLGIGWDGSMRNLVGFSAEMDIKNHMRNWLDGQSLIRTRNSTHTVFELHGACTMRFGSEPDVEFLRNGTCIATIEIKGGADPAEALERLGAIQKSFANTPAHAKNFLIVGIVTQEMENRLNQMPLLEKFFLLADLQGKPRRWAEFMEEIFNHALRLTDFKAPPCSN